ncbi:hypothetical protein V5J35_001156 [Endozoicomonas sp. NE40]|uniref:DUF2288 domain-containing protein n=1 Tax=Endozoicomonas lisbonensis TaxID=3120522 RepID=A0ABV2SDW9_9GAMM
MQEVKEKLNLETARIPWKALERFFAQGIVLNVSASLDLVEAACAVSIDDTRQVQAWLQDGQLTKVTDQQAIQWHEHNFTAVQNDAIEVHVKVFTHFNVVTVITGKLTVQRRSVVGLSKQLTNQSAFFPFIKACTDLMAELFRFQAIFWQPFSVRVIQHSTDKTFFSVSQLILGQHIIHK